VWGGGGGVTDRKINLRRAQCLKITCREPRPPKREKRLHAVAGVAVSANTEANSRTASHETVFKTARSCSRGLRRAGGGRYTVAKERIRRDRRRPTQKLPTREGNASTHGGNILGWRGGGGRPNAVGGIGDVTQQLMRWRSRQKKESGF